MSTGSVMQTPEELQDRNNDNLILAIALEERTLR